MNQIIQTLSLSHLALDILYLKPNTRVVAEETDDTTNQQSLYFTVMVFLSGINSLAALRATISSLIQQMLSNQPVDGFVPGIKECMNAVESVIKLKKVDL